MDNENDDAAMMQAMGFASFGAQDPPSKKRRYNPRADAAVPTPDKTSQPAGTGSNSTPLGSTARREGGTVLATGTDVTEQATSTSRLPASSHGFQDTTPENISTLPAPPSSLPARPMPADGHTRSSTTGAAEQRHFDRSTNDNWYEGYYDPSSNENPWERLEKSLGLQSKGTWITRSAGPGVA
ncbi:hypothetical protein B0I35DRAFT_478347 [Stachybotrys elegans]|uniref:Uncharacterized protein n=1 Tax=Stachybotrys elegans TaxID=80388 RepID=A0A8K0WRE5_9HYPO|nr:hypothetical protein B0I35DRAFT_478347 [Stachybotrys elegans]